MKIGDLNKQVILQAKTQVADGMGGFTVTWTDLDTIWAAIWPTSATEAVKSGQPTMTISGRIRIRYRSNMRPDYRIKYGNKYYSISSIINPNMSNEWLDLIYKEVA